MRPTTATSPNMSNLKHPLWTLNAENWEKWRLTYLGGTQFIKRYLRKFTRREDDQDFRDRLAVTYCPAFAKEAVNEVKNSIFQRVGDVAREGGPATYRDAVDRHDPRGVDMLGSSMAAFIGRDILPELLTMARVGIYVDMPPLSGRTLADKGKRRPYLYFYRAEDIRSWNRDPDHAGDPTEFTSLLLRDNVYDVDERWALPYETTGRYRYLWISPDDGRVHCRFFNESGDDYLANGPGYDDAVSGEVVLPLRRIPFVMLEISDSLLADVADYQIALLNLASSDIAYALKSNFPFYTEQVDFRGQSAHLKPPGSAPGVGGAGIKGTTQTIFDPTTNHVLVNQEQVREVRVGVAQGRQYGPQMERPGFIHPSSEPMNASMAKQEQLKSEIRQLIHLAISSLSPRPASAESKMADNQGLESGLSYIGLELEHAEQKIASYWAMYEGEDPATVRYPQTYSILSESDRHMMIGNLTALIPMVPSNRFRAAVAKQIARLTLDTRISTTEMRAILREIEEAPVILGDPKVVEMDIAAGIVSLETASLARGYPEGEVEKARADHVDRATRIASAQAHGAALGQLTAGAAASGVPVPPGMDPSQAQARGVADLATDPNAGSAEKAAARDTTLDHTVRDKTRGEGA